MNSGFELEDSTNFSGRFYKVMSDAMGIPRDSKVEEFELEDEEEEINDVKEESGDNDSSAETQANQDVGEGDLGDPFEKPEGEAQESDL